MAGKRRKSNRTSAGSAANTKAVNNAKRQVMSIVLFAAAVFLMCIILIPGENVWNALHIFFFGVFGVTSYIYPVILGVTAVFFAMDKCYGSVTAKIIESSILSVFISAAVDIFAGSGGVPFAEYIQTAYNNGIALKSGGFIGALIGRPLVNMFGKTGAAITIILLMFVLFMLISGTTLIAFFKTLAKPVQKIERHAEDAFVKRAERIDSEESDTPKRRRKSDIDISVDDIPERRDVDTYGLNERQKRVVETYNGIQVDNETGEIMEEKPEEVAVKRKRKADFTENNVEIDAEIEKSQKTSGMIITEDDGYKFPPISLLKAPSFEDMAAAGTDLDTTAAHLVDTLRSFGVETRIVDISRGPTVTRYELQPCAGVKISKITNLADDIALNLATAGVRIEAPIPNKAAVGIEVPNKFTNVVGVREIIDSPAFTGSKSKLSIALGRDIGGNAVVGDIAKMPHGLIAGATGSGKSVCINSIIMSILYKATPDEVKFLMIDPKVVELGVYNGIPHLLVPVVTDPRKAAGALGWAVTEMERRYKLFADNGVRDLSSFNRLADTNEDIEKMPQIVIIVDELADLMKTASNEVEVSIDRIAAKARAAGMHLLIATQRPSVDVVTGVIKSNIPSRIAFAVASQIDSRTILDTAGAEKLLGRGDMLYSPVGSNKPSRLQGCYVSDEEIEAVVEYIKGDHSADYSDEIMEEIERQAVTDKKQKIATMDNDANDDDPLLNEAIDIVTERGEASTSYIQRKLRVGYARAARIIDILEERGIVGPQDSSKARRVLMTKEQWLEKKAREE